MAASSIAARGPVRSLAALPAWRWWVIGSFLARLPTAMVVIALVLSGRRLGSYGLGAALAALYTVAAGVTALWRGRVLDRGELRRGIVGELVASAAALAATAVLVTLRAPLPLVVVSVVAAGVASSAVMAGYRSFLPHVVGRDLVRPAYAVDAVLLEVGFVTGPAVAGGLALVLGPVGVLWTMSALALAAAAVANARLPERHPTAEQRTDAPPPWSDPYVVVNYLVTFSVGMMVGLLEAGFAPLAVVLGAEEGIGGICSAAYAFGSGLGGALFATRQAGRSDDGKLALVLVVVLAVLVLPIAAAPSIPVLVGLLVLGGLPFATANAAASAHLQSRLHPARATEGFALITASVLIGMGAGSGIASVTLAAEASPRLIYVIAAVPTIAAVALVAAWATARARRRQPAAA